MQNTKILTPVNHSYFGNPHPQYNRFHTFQTGTTANQERSWFKLGEAIIDNGEVTDEKTKGVRAFFYTFLTFDGNASGEQNSHVVKMLARFVNNNFSVAIEKNDYFIEDYSIDREEFRVYHKKINDKQHHIVLCGSSGGGSRKININPIFFTTFFGGHSPYQVLDNIYYNEYEKLNAFHNSMKERATSITELEQKLIGYDYVSTKNERGKDKLISKSLTGENSIVIESKVDIILLGASSPSTLKSIKSKGNLYKEGETITISSYNNNYTLECISNIGKNDSENDLIVNSENKLMKKGETIKVIRFNSKWLIIS